VVVLQLDGFIISYSIGRATPIHTLDNLKNPYVHAAYNAWGQRNFSYPAAPPADVNVFGYNARWGYKTDSETGLVYCQNRYYDPANGRWLTRDPISYSGGINLYGYCAGGPVRWTDPTGLRGFAETAADFIMDTLDDVGHWWSGTDVVDSNGNPVRVGGWPAVFNPSSNAMTVNGTVHVNDYEDFEDYVNDEKWQDHEERHIHQEDEYAGGNAIIFCVSIVGQYVFTGGHDNAPFEREADIYAKRKYRNPFGAPVIGDSAIETNPLGEYPDQFPREVWPIKRP
jgi:RHS repeat-associated protein